MFMLLLELRIVTWEWGQTQIQSTRPDNFTLCQKIRRPSKQSRFLRPSIAGVDHIEYLQSRYHTLHWHSEEWVEVKQ